MVALKVEVLHDGIGCADVQLGRQLVTLQLEFVTDGHPAASQLESVVAPEVGHWALVVSNE